MLRSYCKDLIAAAQAEDEMESNNSSDLLYFHCYGQAGTKVEHDHSMASAYSVLRDTPTG